jgi:eukaryotic-like serine/threonine-protein kinase
LKRGDIVDGKFQVKDLCNDTGGMGTLVFVKPLKKDYPFKLVLKYCRDLGEEVRRRFRREVRLLAEFRGNSKVVEIVAHNVDHDPPYFVMRYYPDGDLTKLSDRIRGDIELQERVFCQMIDCISELHSRGTFHRDIKPQNFLIHGDSVVVSDLGLSKELDGHTAATRSSQYWGTMGYLPPEFLQDGGFKNAAAAGDVFMLGKTFYVLLTGRDPTYLNLEGISPPVFTVVERCCEVRVERRYADLATLKQRLTAAYDVLLQRHVGPGKAGQLISEIVDDQKAGKAKSAKVNEFIEALSMLDENDRTKIIFDLERGFFELLTRPAVQTHIRSFLNVYRVMVEDASYGWNYAETIADNMKMVFDSNAVEIQNKVEALEIAIEGAVRQNRYAAMDTCAAMIKSVRDEDLGHRVAEMLMEHPEHFITSIERSECRSDAIGAALQRLSERE